MQPVPNCRQPHLQHLSIALQTRGRFRATDMPLLFRCRLRALPQKHCTKGVVFRESARARDLSELAFREASDIRPHAVVRRVNRGEFAKLRIDAQAQFATTVGVSKIAIKPPCLRVPCLCRLPAVGGALFSAAPWHCTTFGNVQQIRSRLFGFCDPSSLRPLPITAIALQNYQYWRAVFTDPAMHRSVMMLGLVDVPAISFVRVIGFADVSDCTRPIRQTVNRRQAFLPAHSLTFAVSFSPST